MLLSQKWLQEFVELDVTPREFANTMAMTGFCIGGYEREGDEIKDVVVGRLLKVERHPTVEKYFVCQVDVGGGRVLQQVTAATNLVEGGLCPVCLPGGHVKGGAPIGEAEFDGVKSSGMLCSLPELGLSQNDFPYGIENGIFFIEEPCRPGDDIRPVLGLDDTVYDVEITANRPDGHSVIGVAREVSAAFGKPFKGHKPQVKGGGGPVEELVGVRVESPDLCPRYTARAVKNVKIGPSPKLAARAHPRGRHAPHQQRGRHHQLRHDGIRPAHARLRHQGACRQGRQGADCGAPGRATTRPLSRWTTRSGSSRPRCS